MTLEPNTLERRLRRFYEMGRMLRALRLGLPILGLALLAYWFGPGRSFDQFAAGSLGLLGLVYLWRGQMAEKATFPGIVAGMVPLLLTHLANAGQSGCEHGVAVTSCMVACLVGGVVAALVVVRFASPLPRPLPAWGFAASLAFLTGALGCSCIGYSGVLALSGGLLLTSSPQLVRWAWRMA